MITKQQIIDILNEKITDKQLFAVDVSVDSANRIYVEMDADHGISIDQCVKVSRLIEGSFDREVEDFELQVASPGADKPFKVFRQYIKNVGRHVEVKLLDGGIKIEGILKGATPESIIIQKFIPVNVKGRKPKLSEENSLIPFSQIAQTKIVISFK